MNNETLKRDLDPESLIKWTKEQRIVYAKRIVYASSAREMKTLYCTLRGSYEVWIYNEMVLETMHAIDAVKKYNSI